MRFAQWTWQAPRTNFTIRDGIRRLIGSRLFDFQRPLLPSRIRALRQLACTLAILLVPVCAIAAGPPIRTSSAIVVNNFRILLLPFSEK